MIKSYAFDSIQNYVFKCEDLVNILMYTSVETSTDTIKWEFCAKTVILESVSVYVSLLCCKKQSWTAEDGVNKHQNMSELQLKNS
jgi:hypothetical protein